MKTLLVAISMALAGLTLSLSAADVEAKRLGGGRPAGMQRQAPAKPADATPPAQPVAPAANPGANAQAPAAAPGPAAANAGKRSWMGPLAGLAAGLGLAALFSHFGLGEGLANVMMIVLLALVALVVVRFVVRRLAGGPQPASPMQYAGAGAPFGGGAGPGPVQRLDPTLAPSAPADVAAPLALPGGMPAAEFERVAKQVFIRLQAANDAGNADDLRRFTTPELYASLKADLLERGAAGQRTDVVQLDARVVDAGEERGQQVVTVRFQGLIREAADAGAEPFDELWHMVRPADGQGDWAIAGISPTN